MSRKQMAFGYYGGKFSKLDFILPQLATPHALYVELFAGSLAVLLNKPPVRREIINDLSQEVVDFWRCLRERRADLIAALDNTPPGEAEFKRVLHAPPTDDLVERSRRFLVRVTQSFNFIPNGKVACSLKGFQSYNNARDGLPIIADRMRQVAVENRDAVALLKRIVGYTWKGKRFCPVLVYADPPYVSNSRESTGQYIHDDFDHAEFLQAVVNMPPFVRVAISGYDSQLYNSTLAAAGWHRVECRMATKSLQAEKTECLWRNYALDTSSCLI